MAQEFISTPGGNIYPDEDTLYDQSEAFRKVALNRDVVDGHLKEDATAKANAAGQAAVTLAATDATAKAATAKQESIADANTKYGGLPGRVTANESKNVAQDAALAQGLAAAAADTTTKANQAKTEAVTESKAYTDQVVDTSHLALDTDGTPYYSPSSMTLRVFTDTDGNPFFLDA